MTLISHPQDNELLEELEKLRQENKRLRAQLDGEADAEKALARYQRILSTSRDMLAFLDKNHMYRAFNDAFLDAFQLDREEALGLHLSDIRGKEYYDNVARDRVERSLQGEEIVLRDWFDHPGLGRTYRELTYRPCYESDGRISGVISCSRDITDLKQTTEALQESEGRYRNILDITPAAIIVHRQGEILFANKAAGALADTDDPEVLLGRSIYELAHPDYVEITRERMDRVLDSQLPEPMHEIKGYSLHGELKEVQVVAAPITYNREQAILSVGLDVTENRKAQQSLAQETAQRLRAEERTAHDRRRFFQLLEMLPAFVYLQRPDRVVEYANRSFRELFGQAEGKTCCDILDVTPPCFMCDALDVLATGSPSRKEWTNKQNRTFRIFSYPFQDEQGAPLTLGMGLDISDLKKLSEDLLEAKQAAEAASDAKSKFLANMSHEIRTPISGILGITEMLLTTPLASEHKHHLCMVRDAASSLLGIINDVLDFSKSATGKLALRLEDFELQPVLARTMEGFAMQAAQKGIALELTVGDKLPHSVRGDSGRLGQVLRNLVSNAIKFTEQGGVRVLVETVSSEGGTATVRFSVADTGIGIPVHKHHLLFKSFNQLDGSTSKAFPGTGLGLAISRELVEMMGGSITYTSEPDKGSTFVFTVPFEIRTRVAPERTGTETAGTQRSLSILLAEDNRAVSLSLRHFLTEEGHEVVCAVNGAQAVEELAKNRIDLVLMDVQMPGMDGMEATRRIRAGEAGKGNCAIPIIALTAYAMQGDRDRFVGEDGAGMNDYVSKPVDMRQLMTTINQFVDEKSIECQALPSDSVARDDLQQVCDFVSETGPAARVVSEIVRYFTLEAPLKLDRLEQALRREAPDTASALAHSLANMSQAIKADKLAAQASSLEDAINDQEIGFALLMVDPLREALEAIVAYLRGSDA